MLHDSLKVELHTLIDNTDDEGLLQAAKAVILAKQTESNTVIDNLAHLTPEERQELEVLAAEDAMVDTMSFDDLKKSMREWRSTL
jgi:DNA topoisomerase VI subunit A